MDSIVLVAFKRDSLDIAQDILAFLKGKCCSKLFFIRLVGQHLIRVLEVNRRRFYEDESAQKCLRPPVRCGRSSLRDSGTPWLSLAAPTPSGS